MPRPTAAYRTVAKLAILAIGNTEYGNQRALSSRQSNVLWDGAPTRRSLRIRLGG